MNERYPCKMDVANYNIAIIRTPLLPLHLSGMWIGVDLGMDTKKTSG